MTWLDLGLSLAALWLDYAKRAQTMTDAEAAAEWHRVNLRALDARLAWEAGKPSDP
jgi:hypothetical protein